MRYRYSCTLVHPESGTKEIRTFRAQANSHSIAWQMADEWVPGMCEDSGCSGVIVENGKLELLVNEEMGLYTVVDRPKMYALIRKIKKKLKMGPYR